MRGASRAENRAAEAKGGQRVRSATIATAISTEGVSVFTRSREGRA